MVRRRLVIEIDTDNIEFQDYLIEPAEHTKEELRAIGLSGKQIKAGQEVELPVPDELQKKFKGLVAWDIANSIKEYIDDNLLAMEDAELDDIVGSRGYGVYEDPYDLISELREGIQVKVVYDGLIKDGNTAQVANRK